MCNGKINILTLLVIPLFCIPNIAFAEIEGCEIDNLEEGYWQQIQVPSYDNCVLKGAPTNDSTYPVSGDDSPGSVYIMQGKYKALMSMSGDGFAWLPPEAREACVIGYAEAYTKWVCDRYQAQAEAYGIPSFVSLSYTALETLCTMRHEQSGNVIYNYARFFDRTSVLYEWKCYQSQQQSPDLNKNNAPPPQC